VQSGLFVLRYPTHVGQARAAPSGFNYRL